MNVIDTGTYASIVNMKFKKNVTSSRDTFSELLYLFGAGDAVRNIDTTSTILNVHDLIKYKFTDDIYSWMLINTWVLKKYLTSTWQNGKRKYDDVKLIRLTDKHSFITNRDHQIISQAFSTSEELFIWCL